MEEGRRVIWLAFGLIVIAAVAAAIGVHFLRDRDRDWFQITMSLLILGCAANALWPAVVILSLGA